jgi:2-alkyl-3-oxoalkanoate reductase
MRVFVTGGTGFTGAALVERLLRDGHSVIALDKQPGLVDKTLEQLGAELVYAEVNDREAVARCTDGAEVVVHLAAAFRQVGVPEKHYRAVNVAGTRIVAEEAGKAGARKLVYCSSQGVHGHIAEPPGDEHSPIAPPDYCEQTKYQGELELKILDGTPFEYTIIRPTAIYGPGDPGRFQMIFARVRAGSFPMFGDGQTLYHPVYIDNLIDAFLLAMEQDRGAGEAFIIGDEEYFTIEELVMRAGRALGVEVAIRHYPLAPLVAAGRVCETLCRPFRIEPPLFSRRVEWYRQARAFSIEKARSELGYQPRVDIDTGLKLTGDWLLATGRI